MSLPRVLASGRWYSSTGEGKVNYIARTDCAAALAAVLASASLESNTYTLTGPEKRTTAEIAALASEVLGKPIQVVQLNDQQLAEGMKAAGVPDMLVPLPIGFDANTRIGDADIITNEFETLTDKKPTPLRSCLERNKAALLGGGAISLRAAAVLRQTASACRSRSRVQSPRTNCTLTRVVGQQVDA